MFAAGFVLLGAPASWLAVNAQSLPSGAGTGDAAAIHDGQGDAIGTAAGASGKKTAAPDKKPAVKAAQTAAAKSASAAQAAKTAAAKRSAVQSARKAPAAPPSQASGAATTPGVHENIITTIFWAGEAADASNAYITNTMSAWDEKWEQHFGGYDDPTKRNGYYPAAFTPKENPFYFALPYNDYDANGKRRPDAGNCSAITGVSSPSTSWCKNAWIKITKGTKTAYAQWQDVGPMHEDDAGYVFGTASPKNTWGAKAGLDVSPAVRDYLGLQDVDRTSWTFVSAGAVPAGPWKNIVTTSGVYWE